MVVSVMKERFEFLTLLLFGFGSARGHTTATGTQGNLKSKLLSLAFRTARGDRNFALWLLVVYHDALSATISFLLVFNHLQEL